MEGNAVSDLSVFVILDLPRAVIEEQVKSMFLDVIDDHLLRHPFVDSVVASMFRAS